MTFLEAWEKVRGIKEHVDDAAIGAIFTGVNVAEDFWDNFILVCNNKDGMSSLLGVSPEKIATWQPIIQKYVKESKNHTNPEVKDKTQMLDTGEREE